MGSPHDMFREAVSLALLALRDQKESGCVDEETYRFFIPVSPKTSSTSSLPLSMPQKPSTPQPKHLPTLLEAANLPKRACESVTQPQATPPASENIQPNEPPSTAEVSNDLPVRRQEKLLPHSFAIESVDLAATRKAIGQSIPLSEKPLYPTVEKRKQWTIFTSLASSDADTFTSSVVKAIEERFHIQVCRFDGSSPTLSIDLPLSASDSQLVLFFVEPHLETALLKQIEILRSFQKEPASQNPPFIRIGRVLSTPLLLLPVHPQIATDVTTKQQLWASLKSLARA